MVRIFMSGFTALLTVAAVSFIMYGLFAFISMETDVREWQPEARFFLVALSLILGGGSGVGTASLYLDLTKEPKGKT